MSAPDHLLVLPDDVRVNTRWRPTAHAGSYLAMLLPTGWYRRFCPAWPSNGALVGGKGYQGAQGMTPLTRRP